MKQMNKYVLSITYVILYFMVIKNNLVETRIYVIKDLFILPL